MKQKVISTVRSQVTLAPQIFDCVIETPLAKEAHAGQFICIYPKDKSTLLPRPISICEVLSDGKALRIVYRIAGQGTREFSTYQAGDSIAVMGPLGNGFPISEGIGKNVVLMGGGIGIPPMFETAKELKNQQKGNGSVTCVMGYRDEKTFLREDFETVSDLYIATEDGSVGVKGNVLDVMQAEALQADMIFACGPMPMLKAIKAYAEQKNIPAYISLEERMACGVGACLGCVAKTKNVDAHSHVHNARICTDGPVFEAGEVEI